MIKTFRDKATEALFHGETTRKIPADVQKAASRKLVMVHAAESLEDLFAPPSNRLEQLRGNRAGQYSIRINDQWRVCFKWRSGNAYEVEIVDYH